MNKMKKTAAGVILGGSMLVAGGLSLAHAAPPESQSFGDGKLNVTVSVNGQEIGVMQDVRWPAPPPSPPRCARPRTSRALCRSLTRTRSSPSRCAPPAPPD